MLRPVLASLVLVLAGACTSADEPTSPVAGGADLDAVRGDLAVLFAGDDGTPADAKVGRCFARELTSLATVDELRDAGLLTADHEVVPQMPTLDDEGAELWVEAQFSCTDFVEASTRAQVQVTKGAIDEAAYAACLRETLDEQTQRDAVTAMLTGELDDPTVATLSLAQAECSAEAT